MRLALIFTSFISLLLLLGCNHSDVVSTKPIKHVLPIAEVQEIEISPLSDAEKTQIEALYKEISEANQLIEELDLIIVELQKTDEWPEAIEIMETAKNESDKIAARLVDLQIEGDGLTEFKASYLETLNHYAAGLQMQLEGIQGLDGNKTTKGYRLSKQAQAELKQYYLEINEEFH